MKKLTIIGAIILGLGLITAFIGFALCDFNIDKLDRNGELIKKEVKYDSYANKIKVDLKDADIVIKKSDDDSLAFNYYENKKIKYELSNTKEEISLTQKINITWFDKIFNLYTKKITVTFYIPNSFKGELKVTDKNGDIEIYDSYANNINLTTDNGSIKLENTNSSNINLTTKNGNVKADNIEVKNEAIFKSISGEISVNNIKASNLSLETKSGSTKLNNISSSYLNVNTLNGRINFSDLSVSVEAKLKSSNGSINGSILGDYEDYIVKASTKNGESNLTNKNSGKISLIIETLNGNISVSFK